MMTTYVVGPTPVQKSATFDFPGADVSSIVGDWTLFIEVTQASDGCASRFEFQSSTDSFVADRQIEATFDCAGAIPAKAPAVKKRWQSFEVQSQIGVASAFMRLQLTKITGASSVSVRAWIESN